MKKEIKKPEPTSTAPKPPSDPWDALGWVRFIRDWKHDWQHPGGLDRDWFANRFMLAIVPPAWIKYRSHSWAGPNQQQDIGYGHAAFFQLFIAGAFESPDAIMAADFRPFQKRVASAFLSSKPNFFSDFQQAWDMMRKCQAGNKPLLFADVRRHEYFTLVAVLEDPRPTYSVAELRKMIVRRFKLADISLTWKALDKVMVRLGIAKPKRGK